MKRDRNGLKCFQVGYNISELHSHGPYDVMSIMETTKYSGHSN